MICHVPHAVVVGLHFRSCISFSSSRSVPLQSVAAAAGLGALKPAGPLLRAYRAGAPARVMRRRAFRAPDCAREAEGARLPPVPAGAFFGPSHCFPAYKSGKAAPEAAFSLPAFYYTFPQSILLRTKHENFAMSCRKPVGGVGSHGWAPARRPCGFTHLFPATPQCVPPTVAPAVQLALRRLRRHRESWMDPGSEASGFTHLVSPRIRGASELARPAGYEAKRVMCMR